MDHISFVTRYFDDSLEVKRKLRSDPDVLNQISIVADLALTTLKSGNKIMLAGNGGSAADAQHIAAEFVSRFFYDRPGLPAIALTTDSSILTAVGNDYGYEKLFSRQLEALGTPGDLFIGISTSGNSKNILEAVAKCVDLQITSVGLCGNSGLLSSKADFVIPVPSDITPFIQESHICIGHAICAIVEESLFPRDEYV